MRSLIRTVFVLAVLGAAGCVVAPAGPPRGYVYGPRVEVWAGRPYGPYYRPYDGYHYRPYPYRYHY